MCWMCFTAFPEIWRIQAQRRKGRPVKLTSNSLCERKTVFAQYLDCACDADQTENVSIIIFCFALKSSRRSYLLVCKKRPKYFSFVQIQYNEEHNRTSLPPGLRKEFQNIRFSEETANERKKTNYSQGQNVCYLVPCSLLRDLLEHLQSPHRRGREWDVAPSNSPSCLWPLQQNSQGSAAAQVPRRALTHPHVPILPCSIVMVTILTQGLKHQVAALLWYSWEHILLFDELGGRSNCLKFLSAVIVSYRI